LLSPLFARHVLQDCSLFLLDNFNHLYDNVGIMAEKRECQRYIKRHPVVINAGGMAFKGTTVWLSEKGFFVRSQKNFNEGVPVDITFHLTEANSCSLKGTVKFARSIDLYRQKNGMGIELTVRDQNYLALVRSVEQENG
jgi:hypothetical protein